MNTAGKTFDEWWAERVAEGYQYGRGPLTTVRFGFEAGFKAGVKATKSIYVERYGETHISDKMDAIIRESEDEDDLL